MRCFVIVKKILFLACLVILSSNVFASDRIQEILPEFEEYVEKVQTEWGAPGIAIGIVKDGKIVYIKSFGVREVGTLKKVDEHTVFQIASLTKNILVHLFAKLVQEGKVNWNDPVIKYMPTFFIGDAKVTSEFTIRDLLSHRSGLPSFSCDSLWYLDFTAEEIIQGIAKIPLKNPETPSAARIPWETAKAPPCGHSPSCSFIVMMSTGTFPKHATLSANAPANAGRMNGGSCPKMRSVRP